MCCFRTGFVKAVENTLRLKENALFFAGLPCCSFVFINLATSKRSRYRPFGDCSLGYVQDSNVFLACMASFVTSV